MLATKDIEAIARKVKIEMLRRIPGMDDVAVALNAQPTPDEIDAFKRMVRAIEESGYEIVPKS